MRLVFMGSAELACPSLDALAALPGHEIVGVVTQPDKPKGRDLRLSPPPVKITATKLGLPVWQPAKIKDPVAIEQLRAARPDLIVVVAYGQLLPAAVLELPARGCINVHTSLLPRWRGASPIQSAILAGDAETGVTTMFLNEQMDAGDIILQRATPIRPEETSGALHDRLATLGAALLVETISLANPLRRPQDPAGVTFAKKIAKEAGRIDWRKPAVEIERQVRAFDPWPGSFTMLGETLLKVWRAEVVPAPGAPGAVLPELVVATGCDGLRLLEVQPAGGRRMSATEFLRGHKLTPGTVLR
jgi:methionyl-tRNA formyltransferase